MNAPIVALDTETDGVHPNRRVWEVAIIRRDEKGEREMSLFVDIDLSTADPFGLKIGRFYDRHPLGRWLAGHTDTEFPPALSENYVDREDAAQQVARWTHGAHIVGAVPNFDTEVLDGLLRDNGLPPSWHYHLVDVENLVVGYLAGQGRPIHPPWKSDDLSRLLGIEPPGDDERHTALGDADWAMRIYDAVMSNGRTADAGTE